MVIVFDLDDTLYEEKTYVSSGFQTVACFLEPILQRSKKELWLEMMHVLEAEGRGVVFDRVLQRHGKYSKHLVRRCISRYRTHKPKIELHPEGRACLQRFNEFPKYIVTDGNKTAQTAKVRALGLDKCTKKVFVTHRFGLAQAKPSPYCFQLIQRLEGVPANRIFYIGDNPTKDFHGIRPLGFRTIRVFTGPHAELQVPTRIDAEFKIKNLNELTIEKLEDILVAPCKF